MPGKIYWYAVPPINEPLKIVILTVSGVAVITNIHWSLHAQFISYLNFVNFLQT